MKIKTKFKIIFAGNFVNLGLIIWGYITFIRIYLTEEKYMVFHINRYNEANLELIVIPILIGFLVFSQYLIYKLYKKQQY